MAIYGIANLPLIDPIQNTNITQVVRRQWKGNRQSQRPKSGPRTIEKARTGFRLHTSELQHPCRNRNKLKIY